MSEEQKDYGQKEKDWTKNALISFDETAKAMVPRNFEGLWRMAEIMARSGMMPTGMDRPETVFVAVQMGLEVGLPPMAAVQNIAVINGRPSIWGDAVLGLVRASGQLERFKESFTGVFPDDNFTAVCVAKRKNDEDNIFREFSILDAKQAGLWCFEHPSEKQKFTPWFKYPKRMLQMRARSWALRDGFGDVLRGLQMREEVQDIIDVTPDRTGKFTADDITEKLKANATETRQPTEPIKESAVPGEQPTAKAETKQAEATADGVDNKKDQGPQSSAWDPFKAELQLKYGAKKSDIINTECAKREINITGLLPREAHALLLDSAKAEQEADNNGEQQSDDTGSGESGGEDQTWTHGEEKEDPFAEQKLAGDPAPVSKADLRDRYITVLENVGKIDRGAWMKSKQQVGLLSSPNVHTMPIEKLIEWATLAQSMTEGKKDMQFS